MISILVLFIKFIKCREKLLYQQYQPTIERASQCYKQLRHRYLPAYAESPDPIPRNRKLTWTQISLHARSSRTVRWGVVGVQNICPLSSLLRYSINVSLCVSQRNDANHGRCFFLHLPLRDFVRISALNAMARRTWHCLSFVITNSLS